MSGRFDCGTGLGCGFAPCICAVPLRRPFFEVALAVVEAPLRDDWVCEVCWAAVAVPDYRYCAGCLRSHAGFGQ